MCCVTYLHVDPFNFIPVEKRMIDKSDLLLLQRLVPVVAPPPRITIARIWRERPQQPMRGSISGAMLLDSNVQRLRIHDPNRTIPTDENHGAIRLSLSNSQRGSAGEKQLPRLELGAQE